MNGPDSSPAPLQSCNPADPGLDGAGDEAGCAELARAPRILDRVADVLDQARVVGERRAKQLLYLIVTSRLLNRPVSAAVKGPSSAGKSFLVERVLSLFPADAYYALSAMSDKVLAYSKEPLSHRILVLYEAAGLRSDFTSYLLRSLLSEGCLRYETVERTKKGLEPRLIVREGPSGLLTTTTAVRLHPENETRLLSIPIADTPSQTAAILRAQAEPPQPIDVAPFHALQRWIASEEIRVAVPFAPILVELIPPLSVRLRRDIPMVLSLIRTNALLHQATRPRTADEAIEATFEDYAVVRDLVVDLVSDGVAVSVSETMRQTVQAVAALGGAAPGGVVSTAAVARELGLDESSAYRRVKGAVDRGYVQNLEDKPRRPARLQLGEPLPDDQDVLPSLERLRDCIAAGTNTPAAPAADAADRP